MVGNVISFVDGHLLSGKTMWRSCELEYNQQAVDAVMKHTKAKLLEAAGGRERLAKALAGHIPEYWDEGHDK